MFLGQSVNVARYDQQKYRDFEKLIEKQLSFFWRPEEVDITTDRIDFNTKLQEHERHIFLSNLRYQTRAGDMGRDLVVLRDDSQPQLHAHYPRYGG
ncbi:ribonucleotide-diphosphate reductase subunit beta [Salmonella enterica subsp. enterica serovar Typhi]|nr:ribonucleotide-diphosphate reductase subunit beta [Salmonella enterica subsp. enterica serovar Typhi]